MELPRKEFFREYGFRAVLRELDRIFHNSEVSRRAIRAVTAWNYGEREVFRCEMRRLIDAACEEADANPRRVDHLLTPPSWQLRRSPPRPN